MLHSALQPFHPTVAAWFVQSFNQPTDVQIQAWSSLRQNQHTLIAAPTGSGKTLAALLPGLNQIMQDKLAGMNQTPGIRLLYITPLKALNNDVHLHVVQFAEQLHELAAATTQDWPGLRAAVRTGDTPQNVRNAILRKPPDILVITPESLYLMLTSEKAREVLRTVTYVIVDEIHHIAGDKRGAHLSLTLERLVEWCGCSFLRVGVSATQKPLDQVARFLGGWEEAEARAVHIIESHEDKIFNLTVSVPDPIAVLHDKEAVWAVLMERILKEMTDCRSTIIFVNNRRLCERLTQRLNDYCGGGFARSHHGSLSREKRLEVEQLLKQGDLKCLIATSSLELGIDVGHIDLVIQIDSPLQAASGIQRMGRAGHGVGEVSRGVIIVRQRSSLPEAAVLCRMIRRREIELIRIRRNALDVLAQQIVAMTAMDDWHVEGIWRLIQRSDSYHNFPRERMESLLQVLSGFFPFVRPLLLWNRETNVLSRHSSSRMAAIMGTGTIPQSANFPVFQGESNIQIGDLDEEFVHESRTGEVFQMGAQSWVIREIKRDRVVVSEAKNRVSEIPFWRNEGLGRSYELGEKMGVLVAEVCDRLAVKDSDIETVEWLRAEYGLDSLAANGLMDLMSKQQATSAMPTNRKIVIERYVDLTNQTHVILHNYWGRSLNRSWQIILERLFEQNLPYKPYSVAKDNGIELIFKQWDHAGQYLIWKIAADSVEKLLLEAIGKLPMFAITFRRIADVALLLSRQFQRTPTWQRRLRSEDLLREALPYGGQFPFLKAAIDECLEEHLDGPHLRGILQGIEQGRIQIEVKDSDYPSPLATQFMFDYANTQVYEADTLNSDLQLQLMNVSADLAISVFGQAALQNTIEPEVIEAELERQTIKPANANELFNLLKRQGDLNYRELQVACGLEVDAWTEQLKEQGLVANVEIGQEERWICRDELEIYAQLGSNEVSAVFVLGRYIEGRLSFSESGLRQRYRFTREYMQHMIKQWGEERRIQPSPFGTGKEQQADELWSSSRVCERILRQSLQHFRNAGEAADSSRLAMLLFHRHHLLPGQRLKGAEGLRQTLALLQGIYLPFSQWETLIFPTRIEGYRRSDLDGLCAAGEIIWLGRKASGEKEGKIAFFLAEAGNLISPLLPREVETETAHPELLNLLRVKGASYLTKLSAELGLAPSELLNQLFDLVWEGQVSNDQFSPLRNYSMAKEKLHPKLGSGLGRWYVTQSLEVEVTLEETAVAWVRQLLHCHGIITKDIVAAYSPLLWEPLLQVLRRLEELGNLTRGLFVKEIETLQFMEHDVVTQMRRSDSNLENSQNDIVAVNACEPASIYGNLVPWPDVRGAAFARKPGNYLLFQHGNWAGWLENNAKKVVFLKQDQPIQPELLLPVFTQLLKNGSMKKIVIDTWNGQKAMETEAGKVLLKHGAERDRDSLVLWLSAMG
ncbi:DEAD/DEAH box helicase [Paenibacillus psychroresistens]|nr:DEAD/DEAH box helicase [Paenibacillus psychroresistens]